MPKKPTWPAAKWFWMGAAIALAGTAAGLIALSAELENDLPREAKVPTSTPEDEAAEAKRRARAMASSNVDDLPAEIQRRYYEGRLRASRGSEQTLAKALAEARNAQQRLQADGGSASELASLDARIDQLEEQLRRARDRRQRMEASVETETAEAVDTRP